MFKTLRWLVIFSMTLTGPPAGADTILNGAGATFPHPLYQKWIEAYKRDTGVRVTYQAVGSGSGIKRLLAKEVDFGGTDAFLSDTEMESAPAPILHIPTCLGAVAVVYHLNGDYPLKFTPKLLSDIYLGKINRWSDDRIAAVNSKIKLPDTEIVVVHRSDGSGTTFVFTDYLSKVSAQWRDRCGRGKKVRWPAGIGVEGNPGIVDTVKQIPGAIGYVELTYAINNRLPVASVQNRSGYFIRPSLQTVSKAANVPLPADTRVLITDTAAQLGYPISAFTWLIFYQDQAYDQRSLQKASALRDFLTWVVHHGQQYNETSHYARLPRSAVKNAEAIITSMTFAGRPLAD